MPTKFELVFGHITDFEELKKYADAQFDTLTLQNQQIVDLKAKVSHLERLLASTTHIVSTNSPAEDISNEESICRAQLVIFNEVSKTRELTLEETRKVEIYSKILISLSSQLKVPRSQTENMDVGQLLALVKAPSGQNS